MNEKDYEALLKPRSQPAVNSRFLVLGFILLQAIIVLAIFIIGRQPLAQDMELEAALNIPTGIDIKPLDIQPTNKESDANKSVPAAIKSTGVRIRGLEITQGIQVFSEPEDTRCNPDKGQTGYVFCNNSMPMVAGRHTLVRLYLACDSDCPAADTVVRLHLLKDGLEKDVLTSQVTADSWQKFNATYIEELRFKLDKSINFQFFPPPDWFSGQIELKVEVLPEGKAPLIYGITKNFVIRRPLRIAYIPIQHQGVTPQEQPDMDYWLLRMYPVPAVEYYRLPVPDMVWDNDLGKNEILNQLLYTYWLYAQYNPAESWPDQLFGWLPKQFYNGGASDPYWCANCAGTHSSRVAFGGLRTEQNIGGPRILVHEIGHNLGAKHAWSPTQTEDPYCFKGKGVDINVDPGWPYAKTPYIQQFGLDLYSVPPIVYPPSHYDMMAYCAYPWISPHTYLKLFNSYFLKPAIAPPSSMATFRPQIGKGSTLLINGIIYPDGTVSRPKVVYLDELNSPLEFAPAPGNDYCLVIQGHSQNNIARYCFEAGFADSETGLPTETSPFFFTLPNLNQQDIAQISVTKNGLELAVIIPSDNPPTVSFDSTQKLAGRQLTISWQATDIDGDSLTYDLLYSSDGGQSWLPMAVHLKQPHYNFDVDQLNISNNSLFIRVIATDGFYTSSAETKISF